MTDALLVVAWHDEPPASLPTGWRHEPVLPDQSALDRAGSKGRTPPPFQGLFWRRDDADGADAPELPDSIADAVGNWIGLRLAPRPAWDDTAGRSPSIKQVSLLKAHPDLDRATFERHYREHVPVARQHHPAILRYAQHEVLAVSGNGGYQVDGVSELWFPDELTLTERYFAGPESRAAVRADNREYIDFSGTLSLLVRPADA